MTEELKQKAIKASDKKCVKGCSKFYRYGFQDGYITGSIENGIQWHDLRKDPNDLPKDYKVVLNQAGIPTWYDPTRGFLGLDGVGVIAWCEIPIFEKE